MPIELGEMTRADAQILLRAVRAEPRLKWFADALESDLSVKPVVKGPWRKVVNHDRGLHAAETLECGHRYLLRHSKNWIEDHAKRRRCEQCRSISSREAA